MLWLSTRNAAISRLVQVIQRQVIYSRRKTQYVRRRYESNSTYKPDVSRWSEAQGFALRGPPYPWVKYLLLVSGDIEIISSFPCSLFLDHCFLPFVPLWIQSAPTRSRRHCCETYTNTLNVGQLGGQQCAQRQKIAQQLHSLQPRRSHQSILRHSRIRNLRRSDGPHYASG